MKEPVLKKKEFQPLFFYIDFLIDVILASFYFFLPFVGWTILSSLNVKVWPLQMLASYFKVFKVCQFYVYRTLDEFHFLFVQMH